MPTGRELAEFFLPAGPLGGLLGMAVSMLVWSAVLAVSFELARCARVYDCRCFSKLLLGRGWFLFEIASLLLIILVLAVRGVAAGEIVRTLFGVPRLVGSLAMIGAMGLILFQSGTATERLMSWSAGYFCLVYLVFMIWSLLAFCGRIEGRRVPILHAIKERVARVHDERQRLMPRILRPALAVGGMVLPVLAAGVWTIGRLGPQAATKELVDAVR
jgi:hypothetical protein